MRECISERMLVVAAKKTAQLYGLKCPAPEEIWKMYYSSVECPMPIITHCNNGTMWVDRYYIAVQPDDGNVEYTYLTRTHLSEEISAYKQAAEERGTDVKLPADIHRCFCKVKYILRMNGRHYWLSEKLFEKFSGE